MIYGQWAEGFRIGRLQTPVADEDDANGNGLVEFADGVEREVREGFLEPDTVENFEVGVKTTFMDNRVSLSAAVFRINWEGIPVNFTSPARGVTFFFNLGEAKSEGFEFETTSLLTSNLTLHFTGSYVDTVLTEDSPSLGDKGDNLPGSTDMNLSLALDYQFDLMTYDSFIRMDYVYVDEFYHNFSETGEASGGYNQINVKTGMTVGQVDVSLFVNNLTNADELTWVENAFANGRAYRLRPRTVGLNVGYRF